MVTRIDAAVMIPGRGRPVDDASVVVDDARIVYAGPSAGAPEVDRPVVTVPVVLPGLWECHAHFVGIDVPDLGVMLREPVPLMGARAAADAHRTLMGGVTSAREVGGFGLDLAPAIDAGTLSGPTIYAAGRVLSTTGGHADAHAYPVDFVTSSPGWIGEICDGVAGCLRAVRNQLRRGAKVIKVCASGGVMSVVDHPVHQQFSAEELAAIVDEAGRAERVVAAHCHGKPGIMAALRAGVRTIEHGSYLDDEAADLMKETGAVLVPTRFVIPELESMASRLPAYAYRKAAMIAEQHAQALKTAIAAGVTIAMGTDIFVSGDAYGRNGTEVRLLVEMGMTPLEAIEAATANGPLTIGPQAPMSGVLAAGYDADMIALDSDPVGDLGVWGDPERVTHVWKAGVAVKHPIPTAAV